MDAGPLFRTGAAGMNKVVVVPFLKYGGPIAHLLRKAVAEVTYTGKKSGKQFSLVVNYTRNRDTVTMGVAAPDVKKWWRNFLGEGAPMQLTLADGTYQAHALSTKSADGSVKVVATLAGQSSHG